MGEKDFTPDFSGKEYLLERQLKPEARKDIVEVLESSWNRSDLHDGYLRRPLFGVASYI